LQDFRLPVQVGQHSSGGRSEIKPSEISPLAYEAFCRGHGLDPAGMRE